MGGERFLCTHCDICMNRFKIERYLQKHMLSYSDFRALKCDFCGKSFRQSKHLYEHKKIHTGVGRAYCNICDIYFNIIIISLFAGF